MVISMLPLQASAADNIIYVDDGSTVTINRAGTGSRESVAFQIKRTDGSLSQNYSWPTYTLVITNGKVTTGRPYFWNTSPPPERENMDSVLSCFTMDPSSTLTTLQNAIYPTTSGKYGTPPLYSVYTPPDTTEPNLTLTQSTRSPTNLPVTITATATDNKAMHAIPFNLNGVGWDTKNTFTVAENGTYTVQARDKTGNIATRDINITNIDTLPPTFFVNTLMSIGDGSKVLVAVMAQDNSMAAMQYSFNDGVTWQSSYTCELPVDVEVTIKVRDTVGNITSAKFLPKAPVKEDGDDNGGGSVAPAISVVIENNSDLEKTIFGSTGIVNTAGNYQTYAAANMKQGIALTVNVSSSANDRFLAGSATFAGKDYPVRWNTANGPLVIPSATATGYIFIDKSEFSGNYKKHTN